MKIAYNICFGGFSLSQKAYEFLGLDWDESGFAYTKHSNRNDPQLIDCIEKLGDSANGNSANIQIMEIPDQVEWWISNHDGQEMVHYPGSDNRTISTRIVDNILNACAYVEGNYL